ncbi:uncharacterized protein TM35_000292230 [Trypanosoma theileri]|uniref:CW-type domain-containing protein n=1 Tax=Trypanosoma theileri TaxID=67003 RepID=A0A1X0NP14_9TRYP|nr:uncharacterized protein TM35_000292230 [Trypanosoma theileri]ORC86341.1 hypothetical protein TM35_000292230 [Trypanosoma theileri]
MAAVSAQCNSSTSMLWYHFVAVDITNTFRTSFATHLSGVSDRRVFASTLAILMRQWRRERWDETFLTTTTTTTNHRSGVGEQRGRRRGGDDHTEAKRQQAQERSLAMYYESIRVQRLMDEVLLFPLLEESEGEDKTLSRTLRRRCSLIKVVDAVWSASAATAVEFLLPVAEWQAPQYYRRVKRPVSVASLYCSVWDAEVEDYTGLKELLVLMRSNCELYNGLGSPLVVACQELVKIGNRAARDAQTQEEQREAQEGGLVIPQSLLLDTPNTTAVGGGSGSGGGGLGIGGTLVMADELTKMFPPRLEAAESSVEKQASTTTNTKTTTKTTSNPSVGASLNLRGIGNSNNSNSAGGSSRPVLRLVPQQNRQEKSESGSVGSVSVGSVDNANRPRLRLRLAVNSATEATETKPAATATTTTTTTTTTTATTTTRVSPNEEVPVKRGRGRPKKVEEPTKEKKHSLKAETNGDDDVIHWVRCDRCREWRELPEKLTPTPDYWECSFAQAECKPLNEKQKRQEEKSKEKSVGQTRGRKKKSSQEEITATTDMKSRRGRGSSSNSSKTTTKREKQLRADGVIDDDEGEQTLLQSYVSKVEAQKKKKKTLREPPLKRRRAARSSSSSSSASSSSSSQDSSESDSSSSSSSGSSSSSSSSEAPTPQKPVKRGRGRPPLKATAKATKTVKTTRKKSTKKRHRDANSDTSEDEGSSDDGGRGRLGRSSTGPVLTAEMLDELEAEMDEVEAIPVLSDNPKEILSRLQSIEKKLR